MNDLHVYNCPGCGEERKVKYVRSICETAHCGNSKCSFHWSTFHRGGYQRWQDSGFKVTFDPDACVTCDKRVDCLTKRIVTVTTKKSFNEWVENRELNPEHGAPGKGRLHGVLRKVHERPGILFGHLENRGREVSLSLMLGLMRAEFPKYRSSRALLRLFVTDLGTQALETLNKVAPKKYGYFKVEMVPFWVDFFRVTTWASHGKEQ